MPPNGLQKVASDSASGRFYIYLVAATGIPLPTLSQMLAWPSAHLEAAANSWTATAKTWEDAFTAVYRQAPAPGGAPWEGQAADAAIQRVGADRLTVLAAVDRLHNAAAIARDGVTEIHAARRLAREALANAQAAGFTIGEDLSVTDRSTGGPAVRVARVAQAQSLAAIVHRRALAVVTIDEGIAARIVGVTAGLDAIQFDESLALPSCPLTRGHNLPLGRVVVCEPYTAGGGFLCWEWSLDGSIASGWHPADISGGYP